MNISIATRLKPFSHSPGVFCILPGSKYRLQIFPTLIRVEDLLGPFPHPVAQIAIGFEGPINDFTVLEDLEKGRIRVWGKTAQGYMRYSIVTASNDGIAIISEKMPIQGWKCSGEWKLLHQQENMDVFGRNPLIDLSTFIAPPSDCLSLGSHKSQEWEMIHRRRDLAEIFPIWMRLGQLIPPVASLSSEGTGTLLFECQQHISAKEKELVLPSFERLYMAAFEGILSPRFNDDQHQGFNLKPVDMTSKTSPLALLSQGAQLIRSLFIQTQETNIQILPVLPSQFHCGRLINNRIPQIGSLDFEWSKKVIRRMLLKSEQEAELSFSFQKEIKRYRLRESLMDKGKIIDPNSPIPIKKGQQYLFDNFER